MNNEIILWANERANGFLMEKESRSTKLFFCDENSHFSFDFCIKQQKKRFLLKTTTMMVVKETSKRYFLTQAGNAMLRENSIQFINNFRFHYFGFLFYFFRLCLTSWLHCITDNDDDDNDDSRWINWQT